MTDNRDSEKKDQTKVRAAKARAQSLTANERRANTVDALDARAERAIALTLASLAEVDYRTALRALRVGVDAIRTATVRERLRAEMQALGLGEGAPRGSPHAQADAAAGAHRSADEGAAGR